MATEVGTSAGGGRSALATEERDLVHALRRGDEAAFASLVDAYGSWMLRTARSFVGSRAVAEEVVQETWLSALRALDRFEGRSSLRTWLFAILVNAARRQAGRENRSISVSDLASREAAAGESELGDRLFDGSHGRWPDAWTTAVAAWDRLPEQRLLAGELRGAIETAVDELPSVQRIVFSLRDLEGWSAEEVCNALSISDSNQRVLLHRGRLKVRAGLERYLERDDD